MASFSSRQRLILFSPLPYLAIFLFFIFTSLNLELELLKIVHVELLLTTAIVVFACARLATGREHMEASSRELALICAFLFLAPIFSSLANGDCLLILANEEFRSWTKTLIVVPFILFGFRSVDQRRRLMDLVLFSLAVFGVVFLYRFFVLGEARAYDLRPTLNTKNGDPNFICTFFAVGLPMALSQAIEALEKKRRSIATLYLACAVFFAGCAVVTESRMGLISIGMALVYIFVKVPLPVSRRRLLVTAFVVLALLASVYGRSIAHRFATLNDESSHGRVRSYTNGLVLFLRNPLFGNGWDSSPEYYFQHSGYPLFRSDAHAISVHDTPLQLAADLGVFGLAVYLWLFVFVVRKIRGGIRRRERLAFFSAASLLALSLNYLTLPLETKDFAILFLAVLATLNASPAPSPAPDEKATRPCPPSSLRGDGLSAYPRL